MTSALARTARATACAMMFGGLAATGAHATEGYFQEGVSPEEKATGGAGVADPRDALTIANNPAGLVDVAPQIDMDVTIFAPDRGFNASGTAFVAPGSYSSHDPIFPIPALAISRPLDANQSIGLAIYGNGGMNTHFVTTNHCAGGFGPTGIFCGGPQTGVNLNQAFVSVAYARRFGSLSFGIAPIGALQMFSGYGLAAFSPLSATPTALTDRGVSWSVGGGLRAGVEWRATPSVRFGIAGSTPIWMTNFTRYTGLFANSGNFDIPASITAGFAFDLLPSFTVLADYKHIFYSGIPSISDPSAFHGILFGASGGPGFGWRDIDVISFGAEWRALTNLTLRAGYSHNTQPITPADAMINILAPGVVTDHVSAGATYAYNQSLSFEFAAVYAPRVDVVGPEVVPGVGATPGSMIDLHMSQFEATIGIKYLMGAPPPPAPALIAKY